MSRRNHNRSQTHPPHSESGFAGQESGKPPEVLTVLGHRLRPEKEQFVIDQPPPSAKQEEALEPEVLRQCYFCSADSPVGDWEENNDACPNCGRARSLAPEELSAFDDGVSEGEMVLQSIGVDARGGGDDIKVRVDHLPAYEQDGRADSRANTKFCIYVQPLRWDYLDEVQKRCTHLQPGEESRFLFRAFKLSGDDRGLKKVWDEGVTGIDRSLLTKPDAAQVGAGPSALPQQSIAPTVDRLRLAVEKAVATRIERILDGEPAAGSTTATPPQDEETIVARAIMGNPEVISMMIHRVTDKLGSEGEHWSAPLIREGLKYVPELIGIARQAFANGGPPQEVQNLIKVIVDDLTANVHPQRAAMFTRQFFAKYPQHQAMVSQLANQSATEILIILSNADPTFAHVRKLPYGPQWIDTFRQLLLAPAQAVPPAPPQPPAENANEVPPQPTSAPPPAPQPSPAELAYAKLLRRCAADMDQNINPEENEVDEALAVEATIRLITEFPEYRSPLAQILSAPPSALVLFVGAADYQSSLRTALEELEAAAAPPPDSAQSQTDSEGDSGSKS